MNRNACARTLHILALLSLPALSSGFVPAGAGRGSAPLALPRTIVVPSRPSPVGPLHGWFRRNKEQEVEVEEAVAIAEEEDIDEAETEAIPEAEDVTEDIAPGQEVECEPAATEASPMDKIKKLGIAGTVSFVLWEWAFWIIGGGGAAAAYYYANGHFPDWSNKEEMAVAGGEAFAFINVARLAVPVRIGLAVSTAPWCDENIVKRFFPRDDASDAACDVPEE